ncbi:hypothetical protein KI387_034125 [Taxus chinensis]|uniref:Chromatin assembly factor 1 subunit A n=1 Tax=Taxus chinensis TaxID=29808 RepID=A0AA38BZX7_TAXCH|nr:hypothetical protein KI387_034125 [Taxus chinensis]
MSEAISIAATAVDSIMENNENVPPCHTSNAEEMPLESKLDFKQTQDLNPSSRPRGRPPKNPNNTPESSRPRKRSKKNAANNLSVLEGKKMELPHLKSCQTPGRKKSTPPPKSESRKSPNLNSFYVNLGSCKEGAELTQSQEQCMFNTESNIMGALTPNVVGSLTPNNVGAVTPNGMTPITPIVPKISGPGDSKAGDSSKDPASETCTSSVKKTLKRKRSLFLQSLDSGSRETHIQQFRQEIESLFKYFDESFEKIGSSDEEEFADTGVASTNVIIARHLEDSRLSYSKIVEEIHEKLKNKLDQNGVEISLAFVKSSVLLIGQRPSYGIPSTVADVLEDESQSCLWRWEVRDLKLLPKSQRDFVSIRRRCRKKIHERITALSAMLSALSSLETEGSRNVDLAKAEELLMKADDEISIRAMVAELMQKCLAQMKIKQAKQKEKEAIKEKERNDRMSEMEQKRLDRELRKGKIQQEKEQARVQREALLHEKEMKRQQEEAEKEQKRREKEDAEMKKQLAIQKQATIMDRFLHSKKESTRTQHVEETAYNHKPLEENAQVCSGVMSLMDQTLWQGETQPDDLLRSHLASWHDDNHQIYIKRNLRWGKRRKPKVALFNELRLQRASAEAVILEKVQPFTSKKRTNDIEDHEFKAKNAANDWEEQDLCDSLPESNGTTDVNRESMCLDKRRKLLQFDKAHRPAYYGTFSKKSDVIGPRHPLKQDPSLDYENDSDEEWEEEDPGESLSDADEDDEEEKIEVEKEKLKCEEDEDSEDGFLVPDGYLSENEGVCLDDTESDVDEDSNENLHSNNASENCGKSQQLETESEWHAFERQQKVLENVTDRALRSGHVFIVVNLAQDINDLKSKPGSPDLNPRHRLEQTCLQALRIQICSLEISIDLPSEPPTEASGQEDQVPAKQQKKSSALSESDLPALVSVIQSSTQGINKIVESLLTKFPHMAKQRLKNKIREIADFTENRWQVKKDILDKLNLLPSPVQALEDTETQKEQIKGVVAKSPIQPKGIATYFSKRCLPPEAAGTNIRSSYDNGNFEKQKNMLPDMADECKDVL